MFYYLCSLLDGWNRYIVHWELRESMTEADVEIVLQRARERYPQATPRVISDNGPQFVAKDFKEFIRVAGMTHVKTSPYYPQSNGKIERWHGTLKRECIRPGVLLNLEDARRVVKKYVEHYNTVRLNSAIGYIAPADKINGRERQIFKERDQKLEDARQLRKEKRQTAAQNSRNGGGNPPHQAPITSDELVFGAHSRNRGLTGLPSVEQMRLGALAGGSPTN